MSVKTLAKFFIDLIRETMSQMELYRKIQFKLGIVFFGLFFGSLILLMLGQFDDFPSFLEGFSKKIPWIMLTFGIVSLLVFRIIDYFVRKLQNPILHGVFRKRFPDDKVFFIGSSISGGKKVGFIFLVMFISATSFSMLLTDIFYDDYMLFGPEFIWSAAGFYLGLFGIVFFPLFVLWSFDLRVYFASEMIVQKLEHPLLQLVFVMPIFSVARLIWKVFSSSTKPVELFNDIYAVFMQSVELWVDFTLMTFTLSVIFLACFHLLRNDLLEHFRNQGMSYGKIKFEDEDIG